MRPSPLRRGAPVAALLAATLLPPPAHAYECPRDYAPSLDLIFDTPAAGLVRPGGEVVFVALGGGDCKHAYALHAAQLVATVATAPEGPFTATALRDAGTRLRWRAPATPGRFYLRVAAGPREAPAQVAIDVAPAGAWRQVTLSLPRGGWAQVAREGVPEGWAPPAVAVPPSRAGGRAVALPPGRWRVLDAVRFDERSDDPRPARFRRVMSLSGPARAVVAVTDVGATVDAAR